MEEQRRGCVESDRTVTVGVASSRDKFEPMWAEMKDGLFFFFCPETVFGGGRITTLSYLDFI